MAAPEMKRALERMRGRRALLVGDFMLDAYLFGETVRVSREAPVLVVRQERIEHRLGGAANTAANLTALGLETQIVGVVGGDPSGAQLRQMLGRAHVECGGLLSVPRTTPVKTRVLAGAFGTSKQQVLRLDAEPETELSDDVLAALALDLERRAEGVDVVVVSDYGAGVLRAPLIAALQRIAHAGGRVCVDSRYQLRAFAGVTAVTPNVPEAEGAVGFSLHDAVSLRTAGHLLIKGLECQACLITQGRLGMTLFQRQEAEQHVDIVGDREVTDVTGAGDTVIATLSAALAAGLGFVNGMRLANCAAGVVVTKMGTVSATPAEIADAAHKGQVELVPWAS
jgi:rfaE bifunctional protein kinase chain/domain